MLYLSMKFDEIFKSVWRYDLFVNLTLDLTLALGIETFVSGILSQYVLPFREVLPFQKV